MAVMSCQMTSFDPPSWIRHLGFYFFLKKSRNNGNWYKIKPECLWNVQIGEFLEFGEETGKIQNYVKKVDFWTNLLKTSRLLWKHKKRMNTQLTYQNIREGWMNSYWKFQPLRVNRFLKILKYLIGGMTSIPHGHAPSPPPCTPGGYGMLRRVLHSLSFHWPK